MPGKQPNPRGRGFPRHQQCQYHPERASPSARPMARTDMSDNGRRGGEGPGTGVIVKAKPKTKKPSMYKVLMLNDDYTPMEFVVHILQRLFQKSAQEATRIMLHVHKRGAANSGGFSYALPQIKVH